MLVDLLLSVRYNRILVINIDHETVFTQSAYLQCLQMLKEQLPLNYRGRKECL